MKDENSLIETQEYVERVLRALIATGEVGQSLQDQLASLLELLATERISPEESQLFLRTNR